MVGTLMPTQTDLALGGTVALSAYGLSFIVNQWGTQLAAIPGFKFISKVEMDGPIEASLGLILVVLISLWFGRMFNFIRI
jgi:hypothetical protein